MVKLMKALGLKTDDQLYILAGTPQNMPPPPNKAGSNVLPSDPKNFRQLTVPNSGVVKNFGLLDVKSRADMLSMMGGLINDQ
jgi:hypothetical protein